MLEGNAPAAMLYLAVDDIDATIDRLRSNGVTIEHEPHVIFSHADDTLGPAGTDVAGVRPRQRGQPGGPDKTPACFRNPPLASRACGLVAGAKLATAKSPPTERLSSRAASTAQ